ncbi:MAG: TetR/AcrR family transcriptional regulator [bacterium]
MDDEPDQRLESRASRRATKTRQRLLDAALYVFNHKGVEGCSIEDITESADVGKGTFYRHFMDKIDILKTLIECATTDLIKRMPSEQSPAVSLDDRTTQLMTAHMTFFSEREDLFLLFLQGQTMVATRPSSRPGIQPPYSRYMAELERRVAPAMPPSSTPDQIRRIAYTIAAAACGTVTVGLFMLNSKHDVMNNLDVTRQSLLVGAPSLLRCAV